MAAIEGGSQVASACRSYGISERTVFMRVLRDPEMAKRFAQAKQVRLQKRHEEWLGVMHEHAKRSPWATAWLLERNFPELYALREFTRPVTNGSQPIGDRVSEERLREYGRLMLEFAQQNESKTPSLPALESAAG
jgi:hypothetical protein